MIGLDLLGVLLVEVLMPNKLAIVFPKACYEASIKNVFSLSN